MFNIVILISPRVCDGASPKVKPCKLLANFKPEIFLSIVETGISYQLTIIIMARVLVCMKIGRRYY